MEKLLNTLKENPPASQSLIKEGEFLLKTLAEGNNLYIKDVLAWKQEAISCVLK